jgi:hypothetical protein
MSSENVLKPSAHAIAEKLRSVVIVEKTDNGHATQAPASFYEDNLPNGITMATVKTLQQYDSDIYAASLLVGGEAACGDFKENPTSASSVMKLRAGMDSVKHTYARDKEIRIPSTGATETRHCVAVSSWTKTGTPNSGVQVKAVRTHLNSLFLETVT